jgi:large subunit ribosomal protein L21
MYAIVETGGRQYRVSPGDKIDVEKLAGQVGDAITLTTVLMVGQGAAVTVGAPTVPEARVEACIVAQKRGKKIIIFKHKRRKNYRRKQGHRQWLTSLRITEIHAAADTDAATPAAEPQITESHTATTEATPVADEATPVADVQTAS